MNSLKFIHYNKDILLLQLYCQLAAFSNHFFSQIKTKQVHKVYTRGRIRHQHSQNPLWKSEKLVPKSANGR